ncbi:hypothetical protein [Myxococcus qinghaiensis]|uniref:hypothetical protein n=1 Tax=Myxococcus qinghaiensis TaxID=2906758 RepID=UPI0020A749C2|nr:hypothetical protein [Myxococcus qinghaiensis]MCP3163196.1 hypothetical protein [Myxococcus qinghaiensis]
MEEQFREARVRAKSAIQSKWKAIADVRTLGWGGPIESIEAAFPFVRTSTSKLRDVLSHHLPVLIFQSRESPPQKMEIVLAYRDSAGNPYRTRVAATSEVPNAHVLLLSEFAQAVWFSLDQQMLPPPGEGRAFEEALIGLTGKALLEL